MKLKNWPFALIVALVGSLSAPPALAGATGGPTKGSYNLHPSKPITLAIAFDRYRKADPDTTYALVAITQKTAPQLIGIIVRDEKGRVVINVLGDGAWLGVQWEPERNEIYNIWINNYGEETTSFDLRTN